MFWGFLVGFFFFLSEYIEFLLCYGNILKIVIHLVGDKITFCSNLISAVWIYNKILLVVKCLEKQNTWRPIVKYYLEVPRSLFDGVFYTIVSICQQIRKINA